MANMRSHQLLNAIIMEINYPITGLILLAAIVLLIYLIRRNQRDEKKFEKDLNESEIDPEEHKEDKI